MYEVPEQPGRRARGDHPRGRPGERQPDHRAAGVRRPPGPPRPRGEVGLTGPCRTSSTASSAHERPCRRSLAESVSVTGPPRRAAVVRVSGPFVVAADVESRSCVRLADPKVDFGAPRRCSPFLRASRQLAPAAGPSTRGSGRVRSPVRQDGTDGGPADSDHPRVGPCPPVPHGRPGLDLRAGVLIMGRGWPALGGQPSRCSRAPATPATAAHRCVGRPASRSGRPARPLAQVARGNAASLRAVPAAGYPPRRLRRLPAAHPPPPLHPPPSRATRRHRRRARRRRQPTAARRGQARCR